MIRKVSEGMLLSACPLALPEQPGQLIVRGRIARDFKGAGPARAGQGIRKI